MQIRLSQRKDKKKITLFSLLFVFMLIFSTDTTVFMRTINPIISLSRQVFSLGGMLVGVFLVCIRGHKLRKVEFFWLVVMSVGMLLSGMINNENMNGIIYFVATSIFLFCVCRLFSFEKFCANYLFIMRIISVVSVVVYLIVQVNPQFGQMLPKLTSITASGRSTWNWGTLLFTNVPLDSISVWQSRNFGPFWEPGAFAAHLNLSLFIVLFEQRERMKKTIDVVLFIAAIATTLSSGGIIALCMLLATFVISTDPKNKKIKLIVIIVAGVAAYYLININTQFLSLITDRFDTTSYNGSFDSRFYSILGGIYVFLSNFIFGAGLTGVDAAITKYYVEIAGGTASMIHNTNTIINYFATGGIFMGVIQSHAWYKAMVSNVNRTKVVSLMLLLFCFMVLANEDLTRSMVFILYPLYALFDRKRERVEQL